MSMNTRDAIKTRCAVRNWTTQDVPDDILQQVLEAGRWAPSPLNSHPWTFVVIRNKETIGKLMPQAHHGPFLATANVVIAVAVNKNAKVDKWLSEHEQHVYSGACAIENMWLAAWDLGLGGCWVTLDNKITKEMLNIPNNHILLGSLALGYPAEPPKAHEESDRRPLSEIVSYELFGNKK